MDHKTWLWRKKTSEKTIVVNDKVDLPYKENGEENEMDKALELQRTVKNLNEKLSSIMTESNAKDELAKQHITVAEEAIAGWGKAEAEALSFKQELDDSLQQRVALEGKIVHLDAALKECTRQLRHVREEQERRIHDAVMKASTDLDRARINFDEKISESSRKLAELGASNSQMNQILQVKDVLIEDLTESKAQTEADFNALLRRLDSSEKDNTSLKYEVSMLEKELEIRNKEREFNRITADASQRQHQECMKKIAKLETECQRLRLLVRKRLPGPAALAQMKNEVESLGRKKMDPAMAGLALKSYISNNTKEAPGKRIIFLTERLCSIEEENKVLKEALAKKNNELQSSRVMCARTVSKLAQVESQLGQFSNGKTGLELARTTSVSYDLSLASISEDRDSEEEISCAESWASALISELEHFRNGKPKATSCGSFGASEFSLMDDFVEMERLAIVPVDKPLENLNLHSKEDKICPDSPSKSDPSLSLTDVTGKELIPIGDGQMDFHHENLDTQSKHLPVEKSPSWIQDILRAVLRNHVSQKSVDEILEEVQIMTNLHCPAPKEAIEVGSGLEAGGTDSPKSKVGKLNVSEDHNLTNEVSALDLPSALDGQYLFPARVENELKLKDENRRLKDEILEIKLEKKDLEEMLQLAANSNESLKSQLQETEQSIASLQTELKVAKESKGSIEEQIETHKLNNEDLDTQLSVARVELNEARQKFSSLQVHLEEKNNLCEELESACLELQLRLESVEHKETSKYDVDEEEKRRRTDWEISAATEKLAECQETILSLGKQLKALASPMDAPLLEKVIPSTTVTTTNHRPSLLDRLLEEDEAESEGLKSPKTKEIICNGDPPKSAFLANNLSTGLHYGWKVSKAHDTGKLVNSGFQASPAKSPGKYLSLNDKRKPDDKGPTGSLAIVPKKQGGGFFRKLLLGRKRGRSKKTLAITA